MIPHCTWLPGESCIMRYPGSMYLKNIFLLLLLRFAYNYNTLYSQLTIYKELHIENATYRYKIICVPNNFLMHQLHPSLSIKFTCKVTGNFLIISKYDNQANVTSCSQVSLPFSNTSNGMTYTLLLPSVFVTIVVFKLL